MKAVAFTLAILMICIFPIHSFANHIDDSMARETVVQYNLLENEGFESTDTVTRFECVTAIIKAIGATEYFAVGFPGLLYDCYGGTPKDCAFRDGDGPDWTNNDGKGTKFDMTKYSSKHLGYISLAFYHGIAKGEVYENRRYFYFNRPATTKETAAFMVRCLEGLDLYDLNESFIMAKKLNLIKETDTFYKDGDSPITPDYFCIMLQRFLNQNRYLYFNEYFEIPTELGVDSERSMTYLEYLESITDDIDD